MSNLRFYQTRYPNLKYANLGRNEWSFFYVDLEGDTRWSNEDHPARTGLIYASKIELLCDLQRFATEYGLQ